MVIIVPGQVMSGVIRIISGIISLFRARELCIYLPFEITHLFAYAYVVLHLLLGLLLFNLNFRQARVRRICPENEISSFSFSFFGYYLIRDPWYLRLTL